MREPTHDEHVCLSHWHRFGGAGFVRKVKRGWIIANEGLCEPIGDVPTVFKTKREAVAYADNLMLIRSKQWRGLDPYAQQEGQSAHTPQPQCSIIMRKDGKDTRCTRPAQADGRCKRHGGQ